MSHDPESLQWQRPGPTPSERRSDALGALALFAAGIGSLVLGRAFLYPEPASMPLSLAVLLALTAPLALRRRYPSAVAITVAVAFVALGELRVPETTVANITLFMAVYTVGAWEPSRRRATFVRGAIVAGMGLWLLLSFFQASTQGTEIEGAGVGAMTPIAAAMLQQVFVNVLYFAGAWWFGSHAWGAARQRAVNARRTAELAAQRRRLASQAVTIERLRIARELHDSVAHHVSLMGVQAAAARAVLRADPERAEGLIEALEDSARLGVAELYTLLGTLRDDEAGDPEPPRSLDDLPALVSEARASGLRVDLQSIGDERDVAPLTGLNLYRIAQESLTNTLKHAGPGATTSVRVRWTHDDVELEVSDDGSGRPAARTGAGLGLTGMRERAESLGGTLEAHARTEGGFVVRATIPSPATRPRTLA